MVIYCKGAVKPLGRLFNFLVAERWGGGAYMKL